jgi:flagellar motor protein MotB
MISKSPRKLKWVLTRSLMFLAFAAAFCMGASPSAAQQNQTGAVTATFPPPDNSPQTQSGSLDSPQDEVRPQQRSNPQLKQEQAAPAQPEAEQDDRGQAQQERAQQPNSESQDQPSLPPQQPPADQHSERSQNRPPHEQAAQGPLPGSLTLPAGTVIRVRIDDWLSTEHNVIGDNFSGSLEEPIVVDGWVVARRGQAQTGHISQVKKGGHGSGSSQLGLDLPELTLVDGQKLPLHTELYQTSAGASSHGRDAAVVGSTTGIGALIGGIVGRGVGAVIGAGVGATAGIIGVMSGPGKPAVVPAETVLSFQLQSPITISTDKNQYAFQPVKQSDYESHSTENRPRMRRLGPPPRYNGPYGYPYGSYPPPPAGSGYYGRQ